MPDLYRGNLRIGFSRNSETAHAVSTAQKISCEFVTFTEETFIFLCSKGWKTKLGGFETDQR